VYSEVAGNTRLPPPIAYDRPCQQYTMGIGIFRFLFIKMRTQQIRKRPNPNGGSKRPAKRPRYTNRGVPRTPGGALARAGEMKYFDCELAQASIVASASWTGTVKDPNVTPVANLNCLFAPTPGSGINQRIGKSVRMMKLKIRGTLFVDAQNNQIAPDNATKVRLMIVEDMQTNGSQCDGADVMTTTVSTTTSINAFQNINNFGRFRVWKDKNFVFQNPTITWDGTNLEQNGLKKDFKFNLNFKGGLPIRFGSTTGGTVSDIVDKSFHLLAIVDNTALTATISYVCRVGFKE